MADLSFFLSLSLYVYVCVCPSLYKIAFKKEKIIKDMLYANNKDYGFYTKKKGVLFYLSFGTYIAVIGF